MKPGSQIPPYNKHTHTFLYRNNSSIVDIEHYLIILQNFYTIDSPNEFVITINHHYISPHTYTYSLLCVLVCVCIYIYIYTHIDIYHNHEVMLIVWIPFDSCAIFPNHPLLLVGPLDSIHCQHKFDEYKFVLISQHWGVHVWEPTGELH